MNNEVHRRKRNVQTKIKKAKEALDKAKNDVKMLLDKLEIVKRRIENFEAGDAFNFYRIASSEEAEELEGLPQEEHEGPLAKKEHGEERNRDQHRAAGEEQREEHLEDVVRVWRRGGQPGGRCAGRRRAKEGVEGVRVRGRDEGEHRGRDVVRGAAQRKPGRVVAAEDRWGAEAGPRGGRRRPERLARGDGQLMWPEEGLYALRE